jgi:TonB family protein
MSRYTLLILLLLFCSSRNFAQELRNKNEIATPEAKQDSQSDDQQRQAVLYRVRGLAEKTLALQDIRFKTIGIARIADLLWQYDEPYARQLFEKALSFTEAKGEIKAPKSLFYLRRNLIVMIATRDRSWAKHLVENAASDESLNLSLEEQSELNIEIASGLLEDDPRTAAEFAARGLQRSVTPSFIWFLKKLRQRDEAAANQLFLQALHRFALQPVVDVNEFALLGTYLFTSPKINDSDPTSLMITRVGDVGIVDITGDQPGISPSLVHAYLETAVQILSRPISDPRQQQVCYVLGKLLLPKATKYAPDLISLIGTAMSSLASNVPQNLTQESAYLNINRVTLDSSEEKMSKAEKIPGAERRDMAYLDAAYSSWLKHDFKTARTATDKITDREASTRLATLINFGEGAWLLKDGPKSLAVAERLVNELPQGVERALLFLGIAQSAAGVADIPHAREAIGLAVKATQSVTDARRPFLTLAAAGQFADFDSVAAGSLIAEAVKEFNAQDGAEWSNVDWRQQVEIGPLAENFPLEVKNVEVRFGQAYRHAIANNLEAATSISENLKNEQLRARAFVELAAAYLETLPKIAQSEETVVRVGEDGMRRSASKTIAPAYPEEDVRKRQQGVAVAEVQYNGKGNVTDATILEAPTPSIGQAVITAVKQWKFIPSTLKGEPISVRGKLTFYFVLDANQKGHVENPKRFQ